MKKNKKNTVFVRLAIITSIIVPLFLALYPLFAGRIAFWYDPARDFLLAYDNLHKLTLIGQTSGIPGLFYGPYWIWLLSFGMLFSMDPRIVILLTLTTLYFTIFPFIIYKFKKIFSLWTCLILWLCFTLSSGIKYAINPWNPYVAPFLFLLLVYLATFADFKIKKRYEYIRILFIGVLVGLILNFHISFGLGTLIGISLFFIISLFKDKISFKNSILILLAYGFGIFITFIPFIVFEARHGFNQIQTVLHVLTTNGSVVGVKGLTKTGILIGFINSFLSLFLLPNLYAGIIVVVGIGTFIYQYLTKHISLNQIQNKLLLLLFSVLVSIAAVYFSSKNPVWNYHFIGTEIIFLLFTGFIIDKNKIIKIGLSIFLIWLLFVNTYQMIQSFDQRHFTTPTLSTREYVTGVIIKDAKSNDYTVFAFNPAIYSYEYSYLFKWMANKDMPYDPGLIHGNNSLVYLIIPADTPSKEDFINSRTNNAHYITIASWIAPDDTKILKRLKIK